MRICWWQTQQTVTLPLHGRERAASSCTSPPTSFDSSGQRLSPVRYTGMGAHERMSYRPPALCASPARNFPCPVERTLFLQFCIRHSTLHSSSGGVHGAHSAVVGVRGEGCLAPLLDRWGVGPQGEQNPSEGRSAKIRLDEKVSLCHSQHNNHTLVIESC